MQGIELVAIFSLLSSLFSLFSAPSSLLSSALDSRNRIPAFLQGIMRPRGLPPCRNAAIRDGPGANKPCCQSIWGSLAAFFVISSLFSLLSFLFKPGKVQTLLQLLSLLLLLPLWFLPSFLIVVLLLQLLSANTVVNQFEHPRRFFLSHLFSLFSLLLDPGKCDLCCNPLASGRRSHILAGTVHWW